MVAIIDYGAGNIFSVKNALDYIGCPSKITSEVRDIINADGIILPGVGAFPPAMKNLNESGIVETLKEHAFEKPFLGICLGMQLLFDVSYEIEECKGLGFIKGSVEKINEPDLIVPHMGWNKLEKNKECPLLNGLGDDEYVYFVHSYKAVCSDDNLAAYCEYGGKVPSLVTDNKKLFGAQFHPEKSGDTGLKILCNFVDML